jgi:methionyl-tRNA formyltransferase
MNTNKPKVIFAGTANFACPSLEALAQYVDVSLVLTQPHRPAGRGLTLQSCPIDLLAQQLGLPIIRPLSLKQSFLESTIKNYPCDFLVVAAYGKMIPSWLLNWPSFAPLNVHGSLLPRWRGAAPIQHALLNNDRRSGATIIHMTSGLDEGPFYKKEELLIEDNDDQHSLGEKVAKLGAKMLLEVIESFPATPTAQSGFSNYAHKIVKADGFIKWNESAAQILCRHKAFKGWPGIYSFDQKKKRIKINAIDATDLFFENALPGQTTITNQRLFVKTKDNWLELLNIPPEGKSGLDIHSCLKDKNHWLYQYQLEFPL